MPDQNHAYVREGNEGNHMEVNVRNKLLGTLGGPRQVGSQRPMMRILGMGLVVLLMIAGPASGTAAFQGTPAATTGATDAIEFAGLVANPGPVTVADLQVLPSETIQHVQQTRQGPVEHTFTGVRLYDALELVGLVVDHDERNPLIRRYLIVTASDGHQVVISGGELDPYFGNSPMMLAWEEDGQPLPADRGPVRLVSPGDERGARQTDGVIRIEVFGIEEDPSS